MRGMCATANSTDCDFRLLISFIGTDKNGRYMKSANMRMSQFNKYSITTLYRSTGAIL